MGQILTETVVKDQLLRDSGRPPLSLYIHWPFCLSKCPYCDFNSHVRANIDEAAWQLGLLQEMKRYARLIESWQFSPELVSIFFGGGTPSLMHPKTVEVLIQTAITLWPGATTDLEITLEANPTSLEIKSFHSLKQAGINRISIGIQALNDKDLKALGREHSAGQGIMAIEQACQIFKRVSFDLIYARPNQTIAEWDKELKYALGFATEHLSLYQLTIEPGTAFATLHQRGELILPNPDKSADFYELTQNIMANAARPAYEISNHSLRGAECQHNLSYWRYQDYVGIGPGAHGRLTQPVADHNQIGIHGGKIATRQKKSPEAWLNSIRNLGHGDEEIIELNTVEQFKEQLLMGLRLKEGIYLKNLVMDLKQAVNNNIIKPDSLKSLENAGYLELNTTLLRLTDQGRQRLQSILGYIFC